MAFNKTHGWAERPMNRFLEVSLLLALKEGPMHGYGLVERIEPFGFPAEELNSGPLYRALRKMEQEILITGKWHKGEQGPRKRVYTLTQNGEEALKKWIDILAFRKEMIEKVLTHYREVSC